MCPQGLRGLLDRAATPVLVAVEGDPAVGILEPRMDGVCVGVRCNVVGSSPPPDLQHEVVGRAKPYSSPPHLLFLNSPSCITFRFRIVLPSTIRTHTTRRGPRHPLVVLHPCPKLTDTLRPEAVGAIAQLRARGVRPYIVTGAPAARVGGT